MTKLLVKISKHNTKLGKIASFSLSSFHTCVSKTKWCDKHCYAKKSERQYPNVGKAYGINLEAIKDTGFVSSMIDEIKQNTKTNKVFRIHVSGDFFQVSYIYNWIKIAKACPDIMFYGYTRAWEHQDLIPHLFAQKGLFCFLSRVLQEVEAFLGDPIFSDLLTDFDLLRFLVVHQLLRKTILTIPTLLVPP